MVYSGPLPGRRLGLPGAARGAGQAAAQRRRADLRAGDLGGAGLRLPLRLPRPAAPGDHPRAAGARVRPGPDLHRAQRGLPGGRRTTARELIVTNPSDWPEGKVAQVFEPVVKTHDHRAQRVHRHHHGAVPVPPRRAAAAWTTCPRPRGAALHDAARRDHLRLLRLAEVPHPRLRQPRLRGGRRAGGRPGQGRHPAAGRAGRRVQRHRAQGLGRRLRQHDDHQAAAS